jgi:LuxR family transcriptional regulator, maltose regulon positive regulatory protein
MSVRPDIATAAAPTGLPAPLALTKLKPPPLPANLVGRQRLMSWMAQIRRNTLTVIRAPSGFGKTTLAASIFHASESTWGQAIWISLDRSDNDPLRVVSYIVNALALQVPGQFAEVEALLHHDKMTSVQSIAALCANAVLTHARNILLVLDDIDQISDAQSLQFLTYLLLHCPENLRLIVTCQAKPRLPLSYLQAHDCLLQIETDELRLSALESQELLGKTASLNPPQINALHEAMEGWVTGLKFGSVALHNNRDSMFEIGPIAQGAPWLADYLEENVFSHLDAQTQDILVRCSVVELLTPELCAILSGDRQPQEKLKWLADQNLFMQALDTVGQWYRIHPVLREFLLGQLRANSPALEAQLHRTAALWFADHHLMSHAIRHALDAGAQQQAVDWIEQSAMRMVEQSDITTLLTWIGKLPAELMRDHIPLRLAEAWALALCVRPQTNDLLDDIEDSIDPASRDAARQITEIAGVRAIHIAIYEDETEVALERAMQYLNARIDEDSFTTRAVRNAGAWCLMQSGNHEQARALMRPAHLIEAKSEQLFSMAYRHFAYGISYLMEGHLEEAERICQAAVDKCEQRVGRRSASATLAATFCAELLYEKNARAEASALLRDRFPIIDETCFHEALFAAYKTAIRLNMADGNRRAAAELLERAELIGHERNWTRLLALCCALRLRHNFPATLDVYADFPGVLSGMPDQNPLSGPPRTERILAEARFLYHLGRGEYGQCTSILHQVLTLTRNIRSVGETLRYELMQAHLESVRGNEEIALEMLGFGLETAARFGFFRSILDVVPAQLLARLSASATRCALPPAAAALLKRLLAEIDLAEARPGPATPEAVAENLFDMLTAREIDVLGGVAASLSNKEIARQIHLTPETVKWHLKNIMRKLSVNTRAQAVNRATTLGLDIS